MPRRVKRVLLAAAAAIGAGSLLVNGCIGFGGDQFLRVVDFCFLFDCQNGALGGLLHPCPERNNTSTSGGTGGTTTGNVIPGTSTGSTNLFVDCPPVDTTNP